MGRTCQTLTLDEIVEINRRMIDKFGGVFFLGDRNLASPGSLEHVLEEIEGSLFGQEIHPTIIEKSAAIGWRIIIAGHIFHDGNKRTGMEACRLFLDLNGYTMKIDREVVDVALKIATSAMQFPEFVHWLEQRTTQR